MYHYTFEINGFLRLIKRIDEMHIVEVIINVNY